VELADKTLAKGLPLIKRDQGSDKPLLIEAFEKSGSAVAELIRTSMSNDGRVTGFRRGIVSLIGYFIAHDSHHRGHILLTLKRAGVKRTDRMRMRLWEWNKI
jgi:uncharacterized damage-inducible protein DinB